MAIPQPPRLIMKATVERRPYFRRFAWSLLAAVAATGALAALDSAYNQGLADPVLLQAGGVVAVGAAIWFVVRGLIALIRGLRRRNETIRLFNRGLVWTRDGKDHQYSWSKLATYREGGHGLYIGGRPLLQWGALKMKMEDGQAFRITGKHGDLRAFARIIRKAAAHVTGLKMSRMLRDEESVKLNRSMTVWPGGVQVGKQEIPWAELQVRFEGDRLTLLRANSKGKYRTVKRYRTSQLDNVGGFMEVATATIRNHRRNRQSS